MKLSEAKVLITGAAGGIGSSIAREIGRRGAALVLTDVDHRALDLVCSELTSEGIDAVGVTADIGCREGRETVTNAAALSDCNVLINVAGINPFGLFDQQSEEQIELAFRINTLAPVLLCRAMLPILRRSSAAHIVNLGSAFGSIGYPGFATYSASKFAVRGFTEALRRELSDTDITVHYVAPRATRTRLVTPRILEMNRALKIGMDTPEAVAVAVATTLTRDKREWHMGTPERIFAVVNALLPGIVDRFISNQLPIVRRYAAPDDRSPSSIGPRTDIQQHAWEIKS